MGHSHAHLSNKELAGATSGTAKWVLIASLILVAALTVIGVIHFWPASDKLAELRSQAGFNSAGVTYEKGLINQITPGCASQPTGSDPRSPQFHCQTADIKLLSGVDAGKTVTVELVGPPTKSGLAAGDSVTVMRNPVQSHIIYSLSGIDRGPIVIILALLFALTVLAVARWKGFFALIGLAFSIVVLLGFMLPALATGESGVLVGIVGSMAIMFVVIFIAHGVSLRSCAALMGTMLGLAVSTGLGALAVWFGHLSGYLTEEEMSLSARVPNLDFRELLIAAIVVAGLGVLNDVTITQASAVWELRAAAPQMSRLEIFRAGMRIGRDHIASTIYTIVFAYAGAALSTLMLLTLFYDQSPWELLDTEQFGAEVLRTLTSATGLVLSVPITTAICALTIKSAEQATADKVL